MILILLVLVFLFLYLYLNEVSKNEKKEAEAKEAEAKKPTIEQYAKKLSDTFFDRKIICDNSNKSRAITFHFKWKYNEWWKEKIFECGQYDWDLLSLMKDIYDRFNRKKEYWEKMTEQDLFAIIAGCKPKIY